MDGRRLPVTYAACPSCGADDGETLFEAPAQLIDLDQRFRFATCRQCNLVYLVDRVDDAAIGALYDADYPLHRGPALWGPFARLVADDNARVDAARVARVLSQSTLGPDDVVLDVGCGRPTFLEALRDRTGCRAIGLDAVSLPPDAAVAGIVTARGVPPDWPQEVVEAAPFSVVTMWHALEHDPHPVTTLTWLRNRMRLGGLAVIEVPDLEGATARWMGKRWPGWHTPRHASVFTVETLRAVAERAGWRVVAHERTGTLAPFVLVALGVLDAAGFRFGMHSAPLVFPVWALGMALTWPWLGRRTRAGIGLQTIVIRPD